MKGRCVQKADNEYLLPKKMILPILIVLGIALLSEEMIFEYTIFQKFLWVFLALGGAAVLVNQYKKKQGVSIDRLALLSSPIPLVVLMLYTLIRCMFAGDTIGVAGQAFTTTMYVIVDILMVIALVYRYKERSIDLLFAGIVVSYAATIVNAFGNVSFVVLLEYLVKPKDSAHFYFERHDIGIAVVPLILYYLSRWLLLQEKNFAPGLKKAGILAIIMLLCGKRSAFLGLAAGVAIMVLLLICRKRTAMVSRWIMAGCVILPFLYVCAIRSGALYAVTEFLHINSMGRTEVYEWFSDQYTISPLYLGKGFQYIHRYMRAGLGSDLVNKYDYLHNTVLQLYIEGGFWGFFLWFGYTAVAMPVLLRKWFSRKVSVFYLVLIVSTIAIFLVDNALTYPLYQVCLYGVLGVVLAENNGKVIRLKLPVFKQKDNSC